MQCVGFEESSSSSSSSSPSSSEYEGDSSSSASSFTFAVPFHCIRPDLPWVTSHAWYFDCPKCGRNHQFSFHFSSSYPWLQRHSSCSSLSLPSSSHHSPACLCVRCIGSPIVVDNIYTHWMHYNSLFPHTPLAWSFNLFRTHIHTVLKKLLGTHSQLHHGYFFVLHEHQGDVREFRYTKNTHAIDHPYASVSAPNRFVLNLE